MRWILVAISLGFSAPTLAADAARLIGENRRTAQRFAEAAAFEREQRWVAAVDLYLRIIDESGDDLIAADDSGMQLSPARSLAQRRIAVRAELVPPYRERVEVQARELLERGRAQRDPRPLDQLVDSYFCSRSAEEALHLLGDLACERGDFAAARRYWGLLGPAAGGLMIPNAVGDPALPYAKIIVARLLAGERPVAVREISAFAVKFPVATGRLAGRDGPYLATLKTLLADSNLPVAPESRSETATRAGTGRADFPTSQQSPYPPIALPDAVPRSELRVEQRHPIRARDHVVYPIVWRGHALVGDERRVSAFNLTTGSLTAQFELNSAQPIERRFPIGAGARYTLSADADSVYARLGMAHFRTDLIVTDSCLVALQFRPDAADKFRVRWQLPAMKPDQSGLRVFEGAPTVHEGRLYVAITRSDGNRLIAAVACYDPADPAPRLIWQQDVFEMGPDAEGRPRNLIVSAAGPLIVAGPNTGAIVALSAATGQRVWAARYSPGPISPTSELGPCILAEGRVIVAPADHDRILAFDSATGLRLWESESIQASHVLGVADGKLIVQVGGATAGLAALDPATGRHIPNWGYIVFGNDPAAPFGRGLLFEECVCWPTRAAGVRLARLDGTPEHPRIALQELPSGNLVSDGGWLIVATRERLHILCNPPVVTDPINPLRQQSLEPINRLGRRVP